MDTSTGRFISQDTYQGSIYDTVSLHKYLYANSNPIKYNDPSGYCAAYVVCAPIDIKLAVQYFKAGMAILASLIAILEVVSNNQALTSFHQSCANAIAEGTMTSSQTQTATREQVKSSARTKRKMRGYILYDPLDYVGRATKAFGLITVDMLSNNIITDDTVGTGANPKLNPVGLDSDSTLDRGHLIARQLGGSGDTLRNLTPIYHRVNNGKMKMYENMISLAVIECEILNGVGLYVQVTPFYVGDNGVPLFINMIAFGLNGTFNLNVAVPNTK